MKQNEIDSNRFNEIEDLLEEKNYQSLEILLDGLHPADIADVLDTLNVEDVIQITSLLPAEKVADAMLEMEDDSRKKLLNLLPATLIASKYMKYMESDDAADILLEMTEEKKNEVISSIKDVEKAGDIADLLNYQKGTAGTLMGVEFISVQETWNVRTCLQSISEQAEKIDEIYYVYVVNKDGIFKGVLSLKKLILHSTQTPISSIFIDDVISVRTTASLDEVANTMQKYNLVAVPVVDEVNRMKGRITIDDVMDYVTEESEKELQLTGGFSLPNTSYNTSIFKMLKARIPWLLVGVFGEIIVSRIMDNNSVHLAQVVLAVTFIPLIGAIGGSVGVQSAILAIQSMTNGDYFRRPPLVRIGKELITGSLIAIILGGVVLGYTLLAIPAENGRLTYAVTTALCAVIITSVLLGSTLPLLLHKLKINPALATSPFLSTLNDISGMSIYMLILYWMM